MDEKLSAGIVGVAFVAPICTVCIAGPAFLASMFAGITGWFGGLNPTLVTGLAIIAAIVVYGLLSRRKRRMNRALIQEAGSKLSGQL